MGCEECLSSSRKWEVRGFGLTRVPQGRDTVWVYYDGGMARAVEFLRHTGAEQTGEGNLSLSPTGPVFSPLSIGVCCFVLFHFNFELFILRKYSTGWIIMNFLTVYYIVVNAKVITHLYEHTHSHTHKCEQTHTQVFEHTCMCTHICMFLNVLRDISVIKTLVGVKLFTLY